MLKNDTVLNGACGQTNHINTRSRTQGPFECINQSTRPPYTNNLNNREMITISKEHSTRERIFMSVRYTPRGNSFCGVYGDDYDIVKLHDKFVWKIK